VLADLTSSQAKEADLGVGKLFLAPVGKLDTSTFVNYYCNTCKTEATGAPTIRPEQNGEGGNDGGPERVSENLLLVERGQYVCNNCNATLGEYRVFSKDGAYAGLAIPTDGWGP